MRYPVVVLQLVETTVTVEADDPPGAVTVVDQRSFKLPPLDEWEVIKGTHYAVLDHDGNVIHEEG